MLHRFVHRMGDALSWLYFWAALPFAILFMGLGECMAAPLTNHRHRSAGMYVAWNLIRLVGPVVVMLVLVIGGIDAYVSKANPPTPKREPIPFLRYLEKYIRITQEPFEMQDSTIVSCQPPELVARNPHEPENPAAAFCDVHVNAIAKETMLSGKGNYPVGSLVIKSKLPTVDSKRAELFTVMQKMEPGYDAEHGDWKYFVIDGKSYRQVAAGRIDSCIECHAGYQETDYITRTYLEQSE